VNRLLPDVPEAKIAKAFEELEAIHLLTIADTVIWFAETLNEVTVHERVKQRALTMFNQLHPDTRDKIIKIPRRLLKLIIPCGRRIVRTATLFGLLLTTMLTKRTTRYEGYKGCCKAAWIGKLFGVNAKRVNRERAKLIEEGWFTREPTTPRARKKFGQWVRLNLTPSEPTPEAVENPTPETPKVQPQTPPDDTKVQPLLNPSLSSGEEILNNQTLPAQEPEPGADQPKPLHAPIWTDMQLHDLRHDARSEALWQEAIQRGHLKNTQPDRINFFAAIAHALRVAKHNACGLLRTVVEQGLWHVLSQADEYNATQRLRRATDAHETNAMPQMHPNPFLTMPSDRSGEINEQPGLSEDALIVQTVTADLQRAGVTRDVFRLVQRHGYLRDWDQDRWLQAEQELAQARLLQARRRYQAMSIQSMQQVMGEGVDEDEAADDGVGTV
ncbi:MAG TPA: hypothetical protein VE844_21850, partial [Gammaproteobacteria bacterium]|nr:hypothetical protein [Gammaproteobacteria bacterium]